MRACVSVCFFLVGSLEILDQRFVHGLGTIIFSITPTRSTLIKERLINDDNLTLMVSIYRKWWFTTSLGVSSLVIVSLLQDLTHWRILLHDVRSAHLFFVERLGRLDKILILIFLVLLQGNRLGCLFFGLVAVEFSSLFLADLWNITETDTWKHVWRRWWRRSREVSWLS